MGMGSMYMQRSVIAVPNSLGYLQKYRASPVPVLTLRIAEYRYVTITTVNPRGVFGIRAAIQTQGGFGLTSQAIRHLLYWN